jgi:hypothetical protein
MTLPDTFDPTIYKSTVHPQINIFDTSDFETPELHMEAEAEARNQIKQSLAKSKNVSRVHSQWDCVKHSYMKRQGSNFMERIKSGKELIL